MPYKRLCKPFSKLSAVQVYEMLHLRSEIFVVEQTCIYQDIDNKDLMPGVHHVLWYDDARLIGYARLLPAGVSYDTPSMGRILIAGSYRSQGLGAAIVQYCIEQTQDLWPQQSITIGAQSHLSNLYQSFGFQEISAHYPEDGIMHVDMQLVSPS